MKAAFDPRPGHASATGRNAVGKVPLTRMAPVELEPEDTWTHVERLAEETAIKERT